MRLNRQFIILCLLLGWFSLQTSALNHKYSEDHNSDTCHQCILHFGQLDDIIPSDSSIVIFERKIISDVYLSVYQSASLDVYYSAHQSRAPPRKNL